MSTSEVLTHVLRTVVMVLVLAGVFIGILVGGILLKLPWYLPIGLIVIFFLAIIFDTARWHAYWAPISKQVARMPWERADGVAMETIVEIAIVQAGIHSRSEIYRVSIYEKSPRKRTKRLMIGDSAEFLGVFNGGLWFYIYDRFHARRDGLVCVDRETAAWMHHIPRSELELVDVVGNRRGLIEVEHHGARKTIDLKDFSPTTI